MRQSWPWSNLEETRKSSSSIPCWKFVSKKTVDVLSLRLANISVKWELVAASSLMEVPETIENEWVWPGSNTAFIMFLNISNQYNFICHEILFFLWCFFPLENLNDSQLMCFTKIRKGYGLPPYAPSHSDWDGQLCNWRSLEQQPTMETVLWHLHEKKYLALRKPFEFIPAAPCLWEAQVR